MTFRPVRATLFLWPARTQLHGRRSVICVASVFRCCVVGLARADVFELCYYSLLRANRANGKKSDRRRVWHFMERRRRPHNPRDPKPRRDRQNGTKKKACVPARLT